MNNDNHIPTKAEVFVPDYKYADQADISNVTKSHLARLESELHSLRVIFIANGSNPMALVGPGKPIGGEMERISKVIHDLETYFTEVLGNENTVG